MNHKLVFILLLFCAELGSAQTKQDVNWVFGNFSIVGSPGVGVRFDDSFNVYPFNPVVSYNLENSASISSVIGDLLFYVNGDSAQFHYGMELMSLFNSEFELMCNGDSIITNQTLTQGVVIIPFVDNPSLYYVFQLQIDFSPDYPQFQSGLRYSIVDMSLDSGKGCVTEKNVVMLDSFYSEKLFAVKHANGRDWWLVMRGGATTDIFYEFLITAKGIQGPFEYHEGFVFDNIGSNMTRLGQLSFNLKGNKLGCVTMGDGIETGVIELFDFNRCTGEIKKTHECITGSATYGCSLSPSGQFLYVSNLGDEIIGDVTRFYLEQYDLNDPFWSDSPKVLYERVGNSIPIGLVAKHLSFRDDKIYMTFFDLFSDSITPFNSSLSVIEQPDLAYPDCNFQLNIIPLGMQINGCLPTMPNYNLDALPPRPACAGEDIIIEEGESAQIGITEQDSMLYEWQPTIGLNDANISNPLASPAVTTSYTLTTTDLKAKYSCNPISTDTVLVTVIPVLLPVTSISIYPNPSEGIFNIQWNGELCDNCELKIYNTLGELVSVHSMTAPLSQIDLSKLSSGIYYYRLFSTAEVVYTGKLLVCKK